MTYTNVEINAALKKALEAKGEDYVYPEEEKHKGGCMYATADGAPSCIVGHVLHELDPEGFAKVAKWERKKGTGDTAVDDAVNALGLNFHPDQVEALRMAQVNQDKGAPWGAAAWYYMQSLGEWDL